VPPAPPAPPAPPEATASAEFQDLLRLVAADPRVVAKLGTPIAAVPESLSGNLHMSGANDSVGDADLRFEITGPRGRSRVKIEAVRANGAWKLTSLELP